MNRIAMSVACFGAGFALATATPSSQQQAPPCPPAANQGTLNPSDEGVVLPTTTSATPTTPEGLTTTGEPGFLGQDTMTGNWGGTRKTLEDDGFKFSPIYYGEVFGNPTGGQGQGVISDGLIDLNFDFDLDRMSEGALSDTIVHIDTDYIYGASLSESFVGDFSNTSNIAGYNSFRLQNFWLQKQFWQKRIAVKVGNISIDGPNEFFQSSSASLFINGTFGAFTFVASNIPNAPVYPVASPGVQIQVQPFSNFYAMAGVFGMDNSSDPEVNNQHGERFALTASSGMLIMSEIGYLLNQSPNDRGLQGTYRVGSFVHTANYNDFTSQANAANGVGELHSAGANYGVYGVLDQQIYCQDGQAISFFVRSGGAPSNVNFVDWYAEGGFNFTGFIPGRENDIAGLAVARSHVSSDFSDSQLAQGATEPFTAETVIEATYKFQMAPWWTIQPDFQYIFTPGGEVGVQDAVVLGLRTTVAF